MNDSLENEFNEAMLDIYKRAYQECKYNASYFIRIVNDRGGLGTARYLLSTDDPQSGFDVLRELGRLDLTVEAQVVKPRFRPLFTENEVSVARRRLDELGYRP